MMKSKVKGFLSFMKVDKGYTKNTISAYRNDLDQFYDYIQTDQINGKIESWVEIDKDDINLYIEKLTKEGNYTSSTIARRIAAIKAFFSFLVATGEITKEQLPTDDLNSPKVEKRLPKAITTTEIERILQAPYSKSGAKAKRDLALLETLYASGMRVTELVSLNLSDVKLSDLGNSVRVKGKKGNARGREIPIDEHSVSILKDYIKNGREKLLQISDEDALFLNNRGQRLTRQGLWLIIKQYVEAVGISTEVTPHTLRHSFAAHKLSQGKSLQDIQKLLGHANISTTQIYAHINQKK